MLNIYNKLKPYGAVNPTTGLPPIPQPNTVALNVYGSQSVVQELKQAGYQVQWLGSDSGGNQVEIFYPQGQLMAACNVARTLGTANELIEPARSSNTVTVYYP